MPQYPWCRLLVVEDNALVAEMMQEMLDLIGCHAIPAASFAQAKQVPREQYDVVLCDYRLPDGQAPQFVDVLRGPESKPIILLTAFSARDLPAREIESFDACVEKPVDMTALEQQLRRLCSAKERISSPPD